MGIPFRISERWESAREQIDELFRIIYEERIGGLKKSDYISGEDDALLSVAWEDLRVPVNAVKVSGDKPPTWSSAVNAGYLLSFSDQALATNEELVHFTVQLPHSYKEGTDVYPHVHWLPDDNTAANVAWKLTYNWANMGNVFGGTNTITSTIIAPTNGKIALHNISSFPAIDGRGKEISSMIICTLQRNSSNASDTYTGNAFLLEIDFHYQCDTNGSRQEKVK